MESKETVSNINGFVLNLRRLIVMSNQGLYMKYFIFQLYAFLGRINYSGDSCIQIQLIDLLSFNIFRIKLIEVAFTHKFLDIFELKWLMQKFRLLKDTQLANIIKIKNCY